LPAYADSSTTIPNPANTFPQNFRRNYREKTSANSAQRNSQGAVGADDKAPPEHRVNVPDPGVEEVSFGLGMLFHGGVSLPAGQRLGAF
jgi:hypothetical protein